MKRVLVFLVLVHGIAFGSQNTSNLAYVNARLIVEPAFVPPLTEQLTLTFVDLQGRGAVEIALREDIKTSSYTGTRGGIQGKAVLHPEGTFLMLVPKGEYRILVRRVPMPNAATDRYYVKSISLYSLDIITPSISLKKHSS